MKTAKTKILLAEDDINFGNVLKGFMELNNFEVTLCKDGNEALHFFRKTGFDCCILDVMMPHKDGFTLGREIREMNATIPLVFLTAKTLKQDLIEGFSIGADDYITKPFDTDVLLHKINAILRRQEKATIINSTPVEFTIGAYDFNYNQRLLKHKKSAISLSQKEAELLRLLCVYKNNIMPRNEALKTIWKEDNYFTARSMDVYIARLRKYLANDKSIEITNVHGSGFRLIAT